MSRLFTIAGAQTARGSRSMSGYAKLSHWLLGTVLYVGGVPTLLANADFTNASVVHACWNGQNMLHLKPGVNPHNIQPQLNLLIQIVSSVYAKHGYDCEVTRLYDWTPQQLANSLHNRDGLCRAADFKTVNLPETVRDLILAEVREAIGYGSQQPRAYDFIFEPRLTSPDGRISKEQHFHGEFDSKFPTEAAKQV